MNKLTQKLTVLLFCGISATAVQAAKEQFTGFKFNADAAMPDNVSTCSDAINYQGYLVDPATAKEYVNGIYKFDVRLYKSEDDATPIWGAQYEAYVKGGYFNLMLGDGGKELDIGEKPMKYKQPSDLWKAMWLTTAKDNQKLYLGLTVRQDKDHNLIDTSKLKEISPRQRLLSSPYAFRAERATYADRATQNFEVPGDLKVNGGFSLAGGGALSFGQFSSDSTSAKVGTNDSSPNQTTVQGGTVIVNSSGDQNFNPNGDVNFQMDAGKTFNIKDGSVVVDSETVALNGSDFITLTAGEKLSLGTTSGDVIVTSQAGNGQIRMAASGVLIQKGQYDPLVRPFCRATVEVTIAKNAISGSADVVLNGTEYANEYVWFVSGSVVTGVSSDCDATVVSGCEVINAHLANKTNKPYVTSVMGKTYGAARRVTVSLMGVHRSLCVNY